MKKQLSFFIALSLTAFLFFSCSSNVPEDSEEEEETSTEYIEQSRTLILPQNIESIETPCKEPSRPKDNANHGRHSKD